MKKSTLIFGVVFLFFVSLIANAKGQSPISLISASNNSLTIEFESPSFDLKEVKTPMGLSHIPVMQGASSILIEGAPDLPKYACSYIIPDGSAPSIKILKSSYTDYNFDIAPSKGNLTRNISPSKVSTLAFGSFNISLNKASK